MKKIIVILCIVLCIAVLSACGVDDTSPTAEAIVETAQPKMTAMPTAIETPIHSPTLASTEAPVTPIPTSEQTQRAEWVTVVVAFDDYHEGEFAGVVDALSDGGYRMVLVSTQTGTARGMSGGRMQVNMSVEDVEDVGLGVIVVGGTGIVKQWDNEELIALVQKADAQGGLVAGICAGPGVLGNAGVLEGKVACWYDGPNTNAEMRGAGCEYSDQPVTIDGNAVTSSGPSAAKEFGRAIVGVLDAM